MDEHQRAKCSPGTFAAPAIRREWVGARQRKFSFNLSKGMSVVSCLGRGVSAVSSRVRYSQKTSCAGVCPNKNPAGQALSG